MHRPALRNLAARVAASAAAPDQPTRPGLAAVVLAAAVLGVVLAHPPAPTDPATVAVTPSPMHTAPPTSTDLTKLAVISIPLDDAPTVAGE